MKRSDIWQQIELELRKEKRLHPSYPDHSAAQAGYVTSEAGKLMGACLRQKFVSRKVNRKEYIRMKAIQTAVQAIRFLENLK